MRHNYWAWEIPKEIGIPDHLTCLLRNHMQAKKQQLEPGMEQQTGSKLGKEYVKPIYCHLPYLTYVHAKCWTRWSISCNQDCMEKYQKPQICRWYHPYGRSEEPFDEGERGEWKADLKLNIQKIKIMASSPITSWQIDGETMETVTDFIFQNHCRWWLQPWN